MKYIIMEIIYIWVYVLVNNNLHFQLLGVWYALHFFNNIYIYIYMEWYSLHKQCSAVWLV